ncbi:MAG: hypothetical protein WDO12_04370 [Pseudomonadota bacterium]
MNAQAAAQEPDRRRRVRRNALLLTAFAVAIYIGFIVAFVHSRT